MFKWLFNLFRKKVYVYYSTKGVSIIDNTTTRMALSYVYRKDEYYATVILKPYNSNLKVSIYKNTYVKSNKIEDAVTYTNNGAVIRFVVTKDISKIIIVTETKDESPKINLSMTPKYHVFPAEGGKITFMAKAETYNSKDNPERFKFTAYGPAMEHHWDLRGDTLHAIMAPTKETAEHKLEGVVTVSYKGYQMTSEIKQEYK